LNYIPSLLPYVCDAAERCVPPQIPIIYIAIVLMAAGRMRRAAEDLPIVDFAAKAGSSLEPPDGLVSADAR
jgi:hypothetical protein